MDFIELKDLLINNILDFQGKNFRGTEPIKNDDPKIQQLLTAIFGSYRKSDVKDAFLKFFIACEKDEHSSLAERMMEMVDQAIPQALAELFQVQTPFSPRQVLAQYQQTKSVVSSSYRAPPQ